MFVKWVKLFNSEGERIPYDNDYVGFEIKNPEGYFQGGCYLYGYDPTGSLLYETPHHLDERVPYIGVAGSSKHRGLVSRTADFCGTIVRGFNQKNPYANGVLFRSKYGEENRQHLYAAYLPMGFGEQIKIPAHNQEGRLLCDYKEAYGELPPCDGAIPHESNILEIVKVMSMDQRKNILEKIQKYC